MSVPDEKYWQSNKTQIEVILSAAVGFPVEVYWGASAVTGVGKNGAYQIMPLSHGQGGAFWEWHLSKNEQWFSTPLEAGAALVRAYQQFQKIDRPD